MVLLMNVLVFFEDTAYHEPACWITSSRYGALHDGMTVEEVQRTLGDHGRRTSDYQSGNYHAQKYEWRGESGAVVIVNFLDGKLESKWASGL